MEPFQEKAFDCLTEAEQNSLFLNTSQGLSTWRVSEILKTTHYKYLEIKARAEKFFKMFSEYFEKHEIMIRPDSPLNQTFKDYLEACMIKRLSKDEAIYYAGDSSWIISPVNRKQIRSNMALLKESEDPWDRDLYALIMEFDRWNNFRILPRELQAPSAFKRRDTGRHKLYLKYLHRIPDPVIRKLVDKYWSEDSKTYYMAVVSTLFEEGYVVVPISKTDKEVFQEMTKRRLYIFNEVIDADEFGLLAKQFYQRTMGPKAGLDFWRDYRTCIARAVNYKEINNLDFSVKDLDMAYGLIKRSAYQIKKARERLMENRDKPVK